MALLVSGCGGAKETNEDVGNKEIGGEKEVGGKKQIPSTPREELVWQLVERGDQLLSTNKKHAYYAYAFAAVYAPDEPSVTERAKEKGVDYSDGFFPPDTVEAGDMLRGIQAAKAVPPESLTDWPDTTPTMEITELRILVERRLVGDLNVGSASQQTPFGQGGNAYVFTAKPELTISEVLAQFGEPTADTRVEKGRFLTYGRIRIVAGASSDKVEYVLYTPKVRLGVG